MMDWTDRHCRYFYRLLSAHARLYTEMLTARAVIHGDRQRLLGFDPLEHPLALQLGGSEAQELAEAARIAEGFGYDEINLNVGCPSARVQAGRFGACLMLEPETVARCVAAMRSAVSVPVSVKCRLGVDEQCADKALQALVGQAHAAGCSVFVVHARKAWLKGLSAKENRAVPPLNYQRVYRLKHDMPQLTVIVNGGIVSAEDVPEHLAHVDGVMLGRTVYHQPYLLAELEGRLHGTPLPSREDILLRMRPYIESQLRQGVQLKHMARHVLGLYHRQPGGRRFRRCLAEGAHHAGAGWSLLEQAIHATRSGPIRAAD